MYIQYVNIKTLCKATEYTVLNYFKLDSSKSSREVFYVVWFKVHLVVMKSLFCNGSRSFTYTLFRSALYCLRYLLLLSRPRCLKSIVGLNVSQTIRQWFGNRQAYLWCIHHIPPRVITCLRALTSLPIHIAWRKESCENNNMGTN